MSPEGKLAELRFKSEQGQITIFHILPLAGLIFGSIYGHRLGSHFGQGVDVLGAVLGGGLGLVCGRLPFILTLKLLKRDFTGKTTEELRAMLRDPKYMAPNTVLLELGSRGEDLEAELPVVLDMLNSPLKDRRVLGWHALASAFPERAKLLGDYRVDDSPEERQKKTERLRVARNGPIEEGSEAPTT